MTTYGDLGAHWFSLLVVVSLIPVLWIWGERASRRVPKGDPPVLFGTRRGVSCESPCVHAERAAPSPLSRQPKGNAP